MDARHTTLCCTIALAALSGCAAFQSSYTYYPDPISSFTDPAFRGHVFQQIAVVADTSDLEWRRRLEGFLGGTFRAKGVTAYEGSALIPPTRQWTEQTKRDAFVASSVDAYLTLEITESGVWTKYIPPTTSTTVKRERTAKEKKTGADTVDAEEVRVTTTTKQDGGYNQTTPWTRYTIRLIDVATGQVAWMAMNSMDGVPTDRIWSFCQEIVAQMQRDGVVVQPHIDSLRAKAGD